MPSQTEKDVDRIVRTAEQAQEDSAYAESLKLDAQQITGTRYKFRISEAPSN